MRTLAQVMVEFRDLDPEEIRLWIAERWVRPQPAGKDWRFDAIDIARVRLLCELRYEMAIERDAIPVVLSLLDQVYGLRNRLRALTEAVCDQPPPVRQLIIDQYRTALAPNEDEPH